MQIIIISQIFISLDINTFCSSFLLIGRILIQNSQSLFIQRFGQPFFQFRVTHCGRTGAPQISPIIHRRTFYHNLKHSICFQQIHIHQLHAILCSLACTITNLPKQIIVHDTLIIHRIGIHILLISINCFYIIFITLIGIAQNFKNIRTGIIQFISFFILSNGFSILLLFR